MSICATEASQYQMLQKLKVFRLHGRDKRGRKILTILAKFFPGGMVSAEVVKRYLEDKVYPKLQQHTHHKGEGGGGGGFCIVYIHTGVQRCVNFPGISALRCFYDNIPATIKDNLEAVYFLHPGLQSRLFLATFGRLFFFKVYGKVKYISRVDYLWEHIKRNELELEEYVYEHDEELEYRPMMDYGIESDHPRVVYHADNAPSSVVATYSMRCIS